PQLVREIVPGVRENQLVAAAQFQGLGRQERDPAQADVEDRHPLSAYVQRRLGDPPVLSGLLAPLPRRRSRPGCGGQRIVGGHGTVSSQRNLKDASMLYDRQFSKRRSGQKCWPLSTRGKICS